MAIRYSSQEHETRQARRQAPLMAYALSALLLSPGVYLLDAKVASAQTANSQESGGIHFAPVNAREIFVKATPAPAGAVTSVQAATTTRRTTVARPGQSECGDNVFSALFANGCVGSGATAGRQAAGGTPNPGTPRTPAAQGIRGSHVGLSGSVAISGTVTAGGRIVSVNSSAGVGRTVGVGATTAPGASSGLGFGTGIGSASSLGSGIAGATGQGYGNSLSETATSGAGASSGTTGGNGAGLGMSAGVGASGSVD